MCQSKEEGGYRCMPSQKLLNFLKGEEIDYSPDEAYGALWLFNKEPVPSIVDIQEAIQTLQHELNTHQYKMVSELEHAVMHIGNMVAQHSDSKVHDFDARLKSAQNAGIAYRQFFDTAPAGSERLIALNRKVTNENLELGAEVRKNLRDTLAQIREFDRELPVRIEGRDDMTPLLRKASTVYPDQWNSALSKTIRLKLVGGKESSFNYPGNILRIRRGDDGMFRYASLDEARAAKEDHPLEYSTYHEMVHEMAHKYESLHPHIQTMGNTFIGRRSITDPDGKPLATHITKKSSWIRDHFSNAYTGKAYGDGGNEVFSTGVESTLFGTSGSLIGLSLPKREGELLLTPYRADIEHRNLTLGIIAGLDLPYFNDPKPQKFPELNRIVNNVSKVFKFH